MLSFYGKNSGNFQVEKIQLTCIMSVIFCNISSIKSWTIWFEKETKNPFSVRGGCAWKSSTQIAGLIDQYHTHTNN